MVVRDTALKCHVCHNVCMTISVLRGRLVLENSVVEDGIIEFDGATISRVCPVSDYEGEVPEASDSTYLPGLVDVHCHGGGGSRCRA